MLHAFFDRDVFIKLACCDLWCEVLQALKVTHPYRLASATVRGAQTPLKRMNVSEEIKRAALARIENMARSVPVVPDEWLKGAMVLPLYNRMTSTAGIDSGEAGLAVVVLGCDEGSRLVTGDKRFIKAISDHFPDEFAELQPRFVSFEHCLLAVCECEGLEKIRLRLHEARECDQTLRVALGVNGDVSEESFMEALRSFMPESLKALA